jgi:hypothetical protein
MKRLLTITILVAAMASCQPRQGKNVEDLPATANSAPAMNSIVVTDVIQATNYSYVQGRHDGSDIWLAILKGDIEVGKTYYYGRTMEMKNFKSKDLDRTFERIYFLEGLYEDPSGRIGAGMNVPNDAMHHGNTDMSEKRQEIIIPKDADVTLIGDLYVNKQDLAGQKVIVKGLVTKFNPQIMDRNWVHIQDGSGDNSSFDLTVTTLDNVRVGSIVKFEGILVTDKDFWPWLSVRFTA